MKEITEHEIPKQHFFTDVFERPKYGCELFKVLHPEETDITIKDIDVITLKNTQVNAPYNDLGILAKDKFVILVEAQSTWSVNILIRILIYLAYTYKNYIASHGLDVYGSVTLKLPKPEFYVIYTGPGKRQDTIKFSDEFFSGEAVGVEITAKVITKGNKGDVVDQYIRYTQKRDKNVKKYGQTRKAARETVKYCIENDILKEYFETKGMEEAISLMMVLFDDETVMRNHDASLVRETERRIFDETYQSLGQSVSATIKAFIARFQVSEKDAKENVKEYWNA